MKSASFLNKKHPFWNNTFKVGDIIFISHELATFIAEVVTLPDRSIIIASTEKDGFISDLFVSVDIFEIELGPKNTAFIIKPQDLILYSYWENKSPRYFELLG